MIRAALGFLVLLLLGTLLIIAFFAIGNTLAPQTFADPLENDLMITLVWTGPPLLAGFLSGLMLRGRSTLGAFYVMAALVASAGLVYVAGLLPQYWAGLLVGLTAWWLPLAVFATAAGCWVARRGARDE